MRGQFGRDPVVDLSDLAFLEAVWRTVFAKMPEPLPADACPIVKIAYKLQIEVGQVIYHLRKCTIEPVTGALKKTPAFANSRCMARWPRRANGAWCAWPRT